MPGPILDIGCGCGFLVEAARRWGWECVGLEGSVDAIAMARELHPGIRILQHDLRDSFPFDGPCFQTAVMNQVIEHLELPVAVHAAGEAFRVLLPGGMLYVASPSKYNVFEKHSDPTHTNLLSPRELRLLLEGAGFSRVIPMNTPLDLLGKNSGARMIMRAAFRVIQWDRLSASANCLAFK